MDKLWASVRIPGAEDCKRELKLFLSLCPSYLPPGGDRRVYALPVGGVGWLRVAAA